MFIERFAYFPRKNVRPTSIEWSKFVQKWFYLSGNLDTKAIVPDTKKNESTFVNKILKLQNLLLLLT